MFWLKNFRIRRRTCQQGDHNPAVMRVDMTDGPYRWRKHFCAEHEYNGLYWAGQIGAKVYRDTGAR